MGQPMSARVQARMWRHTVVNRVEQMREAACDGQPCDTGFVGSGAWSATSRARS
jgi:hypothetical protein